MTNLQKQMAPVLNRSNLALMQMWEQHLNTSGVSEQDQTEASWFAAGSIARWDFSTPFEVLDIDRLGAKAVSTHPS